MAADGRVTYGRRGSFTAELHLSPVHGTAEPPDGDPLQDAPVREMVAKCRVLFPDIFARFEGPGNNGASGRGGPGLSVRTIVEVLDESELEREEAIRRLEAKLKQAAEGRRKSSIDDRVVSL